MSREVSVRSIIVVGADGESRTVYEDERKQKKSSRGIRPFEKAMRRRIKADHATATSYLERHERSNQKKKDGWLRDLVVNVVRANQKGAKVLRKD